MVLFVEVVNVARIQVSVNDSIVLRVINICDIVLVELSSLQNTAMDFVPFLDSLHDLGVFLSEFFADSVELGEEASPRSYHLFVVHPPKFHEI